MIYVGIDVAKLNHFTSALSSDGEVLFEPFQFINETDGFRLLASHLDALPGDSIIGLGSTVTLLRPPISELLIILKSLISCLTFYSWSP